MIEELREKVKKLIDENSYREVTRFTNNKNIGIYMIYINNFEDDKIIPIYIGQTNRDFQTRYSEHLKELLALNRLDFDYYKELLLDGFYSSSLKTCKIFQYMVDHNCTLKDFHFIVIEEVDKNIKDLKTILDKKEKEYFKKYVPSAFGFNQISTVSDSIKCFFSNENDNSKNERMLLESLLDDAMNFYEYFGYGYTKFNFYYSFMNPTIEFKDDKNNRTDIEKKIMEIEEKLYEKHYDDNKFNIRKKFKAMHEISLEDEECRKRIEEKCEKEIEAYCKRNKIDIYRKYNEIKELVLYQNPDAIKKFEIYLKRRNTKENIIEVLKKDKEFTELRDEFIREKERFHIMAKELNECRKASKIDSLTRLLPRKNYNTLPLKDMYRSIVFYNDVQLKNSAKIIFEFSNNGLSKLLYDYSIIKIDYYIQKEGKVIEKKDLFIRVKDFETESKYYEADTGKKIGRKEPYNVKRLNDYISTTMEYNNGINDYTYMNYKKYELEDVLDEINSLIDSDTTLSIKIPNKMRNLFKRYIEENYSKSNILKNRLLEC